MPTFAEHPFDFAHYPVDVTAYIEAGVPAQQAPYVEHALRTVAADLIRRAEDVGTTVFMEMAAEGETPPDLTRDEIDCFQLGAMIGSQVTLAHMVELGALNEKVYQDHIVKTLRAEMEKGWRP